MKFKSYYEAVKETGVVSYATALRRVKAGMDRVEALTTPPHQKTSNAIFPGKPFGRLIVRERVILEGSKSRDTRWACDCSCGNHVVILGKNLRSGRTTSCGCYRKELSSQRKLNEQGKGEST